MQIEKRNIRDLKFYPGNPRKISNEMLESLKKSLSEFGIVDPLVINKDNQVIGGNQRLKVLQELGVQEVDVVVVDFPKSKEKALNIALNKIIGEFDEELLRVFIEDIEPLDIELTGLDDSEIKFLTLSEDDFGTEFVLPEGDRLLFQQITFIFADKQAEFIEKMLKVAKESNNIETFGNKNQNGNAIYRIVKEWVEQRI